MPYSKFLSQQNLKQVEKEETAIEYGEHLFQTITLKPFKPTDESPTQPSEGRKSFRDILSEFYRSETLNHENPEFMPNPLPRLIRKHQLNIVIFNLHPMNSGITVEVSGYESPKPMFIPYEDPLLECIDRGELHPAFVDQIKHLDVFYDGCVLAEIRDHRRNKDSLVDRSPPYNSHFVVLKPTTQTFFADLDAIAPENEWSRDDRLRLESELLCATAGPLCLDPNPAVGVLANRVQYCKNNLHRPSLRQMATKQSQVSVNRKTQLEDLPLPPFLEQVKVLSKLKKNFACPIPEKIYCPSQVEIPIVDSAKILPKVLDIPKCSNDAVSSLSQYFQERYIKIKEKTGNIQCVSISIKEIPEEGNFTVTPKFQYNGQGEFKEGLKCTFSSKELAIKYIDQFIETFTVKGTLIIDDNSDSREMINPVDVQGAVKDDTPATVITTNAPTVFPVESTSCGRTFHSLEDSEQYMDVDSPIIIFENTIPSQNCRSKRNRSSSSSSDS